MHFAICPKRTILMAMILLLPGFLCLHSAPFKWQVISSNNQELVLRLDLSNLKFTEKATEDGTSVLVPDLPSATNENQSAGAPQSFVYSSLISVPASDAFSIANISVTRKAIDGTIAPVSRFKKVEGIPTELFNIDHDLYQQSQVKDFVSLDYAGISRDRHLAALKVRIAQWDGAANSIIAPLEINLTIKFKTSDKTQNTAFDKFNPVITLNHSAGNEWRIPMQRRDDKQIAQSKVQSAGNKWYRIPVTNEGIYEISQSTLQSAGINLTRDEVKTIKVYGNGGLSLSEDVPTAESNKLKEQDIVVRTNNDGSLKSIYFYAGGVGGFTYNRSSRDARHYINHYSANIYYLLTWGGEQGARAVPRANQQGSVQSNPLSYYQTLYFEEEQVNAFNEGSGKYWFGGSYFPYTFTNVFNNLDRSGKITYRLSLVHIAGTQGLFKIYEGSNKLAESVISAVDFNDYRDAQRNEVVVTMPASAMPDDNRSSLRVEYQNDYSNSAIARFDYYEIYYPRSFVPINNEISIFTDTTMKGLTEFSINGFSGQDMIGFDISSPDHPVQLDNSSTTGGMFKFRDSLSVTSMHKYFVSSSFRPAGLELIEWNDLRSAPANAEIIVIAPPELKASAQKYVDYRNSQHVLKAVLVTTDQIFNEYGYCIRDISAIRNYVAYAFSNWNVKPQYLVLWGDGHYDYRNIGTKKPNYIPPYESDDIMMSYYEINSYCSDDYYVRVSGQDPVDDLAVGRIPVDSPERGDWMVEKIKRYENQSSAEPWRTTITMLADDSPKGNKGFDGATHTNDSEVLANQYMPQDLQQKKIYLVEYPTENVTGGRRKPRVTEDLLTSVNLYGTLFVTYVGHGNPRVWAHEEVFERSQTVPLMVNSDKYFFTSVASCDFGRWDLADVNSGAEELVYSKNGGSIGVFASTRVVFAGDNALLHEELYSNIFDRNQTTGLYPTIGEAWYKTKLERINSNDTKFNFLGDPVIRPLIPSEKIVIETINGANVECDSCMTSLKALQNVKLSGRITFGNSAETDTSFNGTVILNMFDSDQQITAIDVDNSVHNILKNGGALNRSSYVVTNGRFSAEFIIPKDISFSGQSGRIYTYAYTNDNRFAKGINRHFLLGGIDTSNFMDISGPDINVYMENKNFKEGDYVGQNPLLIVDLKDMSGINSTGIGIGHRIEAWVDDNPSSIDLTSKFTSSLSDPKSGIAADKLNDLAAGYHNVKVRAWDVLNNYSLGYTNFRIAGAGDDVLAWDIVCYPDPVIDNATFRFKHNITPPFNAQIDIYNEMNQKVRTMVQTAATSYITDVPWDGLDDAGHKLAQGPYTFRVNITTLKMEKRTFFGLFTLVR